MIPGAVNLNRLFLWLGHGSHQTFHLVPAVTLLEIMLRNRCRPTTFHTITTGDTDKWSQKWPVRSTPQPVHTTGSYVTNGRFSPWDCSVPCKLRWQERPPCHRQSQMAVPLEGWMPIQIWMTSVTDGMKHGSRTTVVLATTMSARPVRSWHLADPSSLRHRPTSLDTCCLTCGLHLLARWAHPYSLRPFKLWGTFTVCNASHILYFEGHYVSPTNQSRWNSSLGFYVWWCILMNALWGTHTSYMFSCHLERCPYSP